MHKKSLEAAAHLENGEIDKDSNDEDDVVPQEIPTTTSDNNDNSNDDDDKVCLYQYNNIY